MITIEIHEETATREDMVYVLERIAELLREGYVMGHGPSWETSGEEEEEEEDSEDEEAADELIEEGLPVSPEEDGSSDQQESEETAIQQGLEHGHYTRVTNELVDELAELTIPWLNRDRTRLPFIDYYARPTYGPEFSNCLRYGSSDRELSPEEFLARARVTDRQLIKKKRGQQPRPEPKLGDIVMFIPRQECPDAPKVPGRIKRINSNGLVLCNGWPDPLNDGDGWSIESLRPATTEEVALYKQEKRAKKLVRGCRVSTPDGEGIYLGRSKKWRVGYVSRDMDKMDDPIHTYNLHEIMPLPQK